MVVLILCATTCDASSTGESAADAGGQRVAPSPERDGDRRPRCSLSNEAAEEPTSQATAEELAAASVGVDQLDNVTSNRQMATVCGQTLEVWRVSGSLPNGDDVTVLVGYSTGVVVKGLISGPGD